MLVDLLALRLTMACTPLANGRARFQLYREPPLWLPHLLSRLLQIGAQIYLTLTRRRIVQEHLPPYFVVPSVKLDLALAAHLSFRSCDGTFIAYDDTSLEPLWKLNVGSGINAPPMTFEAGGKQYVAILTGLSRVSKTRHILTPELREMRHQTMLFVFGL